MDVNDPRWFRSIGAEKLMEAGEREREVKDMAEIKGAIVLEGVPNDIIVVDNTTGEKMILLKVTSTNCADYCIAVDKDGDVQCRSVDEIKVLLTDEQKKLLIGGIK